MRACALFAGPRHLTRSTEHCRGASYDRPTAPAPGAAVPVESGLASRMLSAYVALHARGYLYETIAEIVADVCRSTESFEVRVPFSQKSPR